MSEGRDRKMFTSLLHHASKWGLNFRADDVQQSIEHLPNPQLWCLLNAQQVNVLIYARLSVFSILDHEQGLTVTVRKPSWAMFSR